MFELLCSKTCITVLITSFQLQAFMFINAKCEAAAAMKRNPRKINWTVLYRRKHKKGIEEEKSKKRTRRTTKFQRAITGATLGDIMAKRNQKPEVRKAQREQAIRCVLVDVNQCSKLMGNRKLPSGQQSLYFVLPS